MILLLDNYDSFTWNLVQYFGELGVEPAVVRNDQTTAPEAIACQPRAIVISPGPCTPAEAGISIELIRAAAEAGIPVLGVCLGHQAIGEAFGARVVRADRQMHGKTSWINHAGTGLFADIPQPAEVMRYHSLIIAPDSIPEDLDVTACAADRPDHDEIMAVAHRSRPIFGVQFHPESIGTSAGKQILVNFLSLASVTA